MDKRFKRFIIAGRGIKDNVFRLVNRTELKIFLYDAVITRECVTNFIVVDLNKLDEIPLSVILDITSYCNYDPMNIKTLYYIGDYNAIKDLIIKYMAK